MDFQTEDIIHEIEVSIKKKYKEYEIELKINEETNSLNILIKKNNDINYYKSNFNEHYLQQKLKLRESINNIYCNICDLINKKEIKNNENQNNLKLEFKFNESYIELNREKVCEEMLNEIMIKRKKKKNY